MRITQRSDEELNNILEPGIYDATVRQAEDCTSKADNEMIKLTLVVFGRNGESRTVFAYLLNAMPKPLKHFCRAVGRINLYEQDLLSAADCCDKSVRVRLGVRPAEGEYEAQNQVKDYLPPGSAPAARPPVVQSQSPPAESGSAPNDADSDVPF